MKACIAIALSHALVAGGVAVVEAQSAQPLVPPRREFPLQCRGGGGVVFDTLLAAGAAERTTRLMLTFAAAERAAGPEGQGLEPGTCAWVDRTLNPDEPRRIEFSIGLDDTTPDRTVADPGLYWSFLAHNEDVGRLTGIGYRHWHASSPPEPRSVPAPVAVSRRSLPLPFDVRWLPLMVFGLVVVAWAPMLILTARASGWRRLADFYPSRSSGTGRSFRCSPILMRMSNYRGGARLTPDESHLHFGQSVLTRPGHPSFSVPWSDITASRDEWPWFPLKGHPMVRLTLAKDPDLRILMPLRDGERIVAASGGRLALDEPHVLTAALSR